MHNNFLERKTFHLNTLLAISMVECLVANKKFVLYCIIVLNEPSLLDKMADQNLDL